MLRGKEFATFFRDVNLVIAFVDVEVQLLVDDRHAPTLLLEVLQLRLAHQFVGTWILEQLHQAAMLWHAAVRSEEVHASLLALLLPIGLEQTLSVGYDRVDELRLGVYQAFDAGIHLHKGPLGVATGYGSGDDQRRTGFVDQYRVNFVDHGKPVWSLHHVVGVVDHVVAEVVEAELVVGAIGDVGCILHLALLWLHVRLDTARADSQHVENGFHPLAVPASQVVVHRDEVDATSGKRIQVEG